MRPIFTALMGSVVFGFPGAARADDLAEALNFAASIMGDEIVEGYEDFMDWDETEALPILLAKKVVPGEPPEFYGKDSAGFEPRTSFFQTLGASRLDFPTLRPFIEEAFAAADTHRIRAGLTVNTARSSAGPASCRRT